MSIGWGNFDFSVLPALYGLSVMIAWFAADRLREGILFQKPLYVTAAVCLIGVFLAYLTELAFPQAEWLSNLIELIGIMAGFVLLHRSLLSKVANKWRWNIAIGVVLLLLVLTPVLFHTLSI
ncbi:MULTISPECIES: hypothetical protein [unclassified Ruegeria]|uniref:hypothetical protein n=1 Tax=unclassified Ruegeria TaxID=2625375 RepID=UPI001487FD1F|nr:MULTISPECIES: hypothetical protein [unclassified Ruegeria]NOD63142.1 hypothetical protein [Ruegeria sp. HKCCD6109]